MSLTTPRAPVDLADALITLGALLLVAGVAMVNVAAACVVGGLELILGGIALTRRNTHGTSG